MSVAIKAYYDSSGKIDDPNTRYLTLAGYAGSPNAWRLFEERWSRVLKRHGCAYMHMREFNSSQGNFKGWTKPKKNELKKDLFNECFSEIGWGQYKGEFVGASCTINLNDYDRACTDKPSLFKKKPEYICTNFVVNIAMMVLPDNKNMPFGKGGTIELYFDKGEPFLHTIDRIWRDKPKNQLKGPLQLISKIAKVDKHQVIGLQAADFLAWSSNRSYVGNPTHNYLEAKPDSVSADISRKLACPLYERYYDHIRLMEDKLF